MARTFVVADTHGHPELLYELIEKANPDKAKGDVVVHIGDLINAVDESTRGDLECLEYAANIFDVLLVGNHEYPYFATNPLGGFHGFKFKASIEAAIFNIERDKWQPSHCVGNTLITHAGLHPKFWGPRKYIETAEQADKALKTAWGINNLSSVFSNCGYARGGKQEFGGILWADWDEEKSPLFNQLVGHTPQRDGRIKTKIVSGYLTWCTNIDTGAKWDQDNLTGVWLDENGHITEVVHI